MNHGGAGRVGWLAGLLLIALSASALAGCRAVSPAVIEAAAQVQAAQGTAPTAANGAGAVTDGPTAVPTAIRTQPPAPVLDAAPGPAQSVEWRSAGEPAGCLSAQEQAGMASWQAMLAYADSLLPLAVPLKDRLLPASWNAPQQRFIHQDGQAITIAVSSLRYDPMLQNVLNALHVAGFAAWLRETPEQQLHILAIPLLDLNWQAGNWPAYISAYWQERHSLPPEDSAVRPGLKLPPCRWMVEAGYAPEVDAGWWASDPLGWPDYAATVPDYLADDTPAADQVAARIDWLGAGGSEGAATMCGPLAWAVMQDAQAFPPGVGGWSTGPKSFWLSKPSANGRPWSLFPPESYTLYQYDFPLGRFNFAAWPLYPGDFLYTYSQGDGFDHMVLVTDVDPAGNIYVVTNRVWEKPAFKVTIERVMFASLADPEAGIAKNEWYSDRINGRTGHAGFDVFRWAWADKDIQNKAAPYTIQVGDTLGLVAARWRTPAEQIAQYNGLTLNADLSIGQVLMIPPNRDAWR